MKKKDNLHQNVNIKGPRYQQVWCTYVKLQFVH
jgi:hypothetical protein